MTVPAKRPATLTGVESASPERPAHGFATAIGGGLGQVRRMSRPVVHRALSRLATPVTRVRNRARSC